MNTIQRATITVVMTLASLGAAHAAAPTGAAADYGMPAATANADRVIHIEANIKYVNVNSGETVQFEVGGKTFSWHFDIYGNSASFDLAKIAPSGVDVHGVRAYVASNPLYRG